MLRKSYFWLPYAAFAFLIAGTAVAGIPESLVTRTGLIALGLIVFAGLLFCLQLYSCFGPGSREKRRDARISLIVSALVYLAFLAVAEIILPPSLPSPPAYDHTRKSLRELLARRNSVVEKEFRGAEIRLEFNQLGWADRSRDYLPGGEKIVFIGDSFLEWKNTRRLAEITESLLREKNLAVDVVNLSKDDTDPPQYRHWFYELALDLKPEWIFLFIYGGNDLQTDFRYEPYRHPHFAFSRRAIALLEMMNIPPPSADRIRQFRKREEVFQDKQDLFSELDGLDLSPGEKNLIYLTAFGFSGREKAGAPVFRDFFAALGGKIEEGIQSLAGYLRSPLLWKRGRYLYPHQHPRYIEIFERPRNQRLEEMAKFISDYYLLSDDHTLQLSMLEERDERFRTYLIEEPDGTLYLMTALKAAGRDSGVAAEGSSSQAIPAAAAEYLKFFEELRERAEAEGSRFAVVLIPEASLIDEDFYRFWLPLCDFRKYFSDKHQIYSLLGERLRGKVPLIDLGQLPERFFDGYYKLDGHWNDRGNQAAAEIIADYIYNQE